MTLLLIVLLVVLWGAVIVPALLRNRQAPRSRADRVREGLAALNARPGDRPPARSPAGAVGRWILAPANPRPSSRSGHAGASRSATRPTGGSGASGASRRPGFGGVDLGRPSLDGPNPVDQRRSIFFSLVVGAVSSLLFGLLLSMALLVKMSLLIDVALAGYVVYLVRTKGTGRGRPYVEHVDSQPEEEHWLRAGEM